MSTTDVLFKRLNVSRVIVRNIPGIFFFFRIAMHSKNARCCAAHHGLNNVHLSSTLNFTTIAVSARWDELNKNVSSVFLPVVRHIAFIYIVAAVRIEIEKNFFFLPESENRGN